MGVGGRACVAGGHLAGLPLELADLLRQRGLQALREAFLLANGGQAPILQEQLDVLHLRGGQPRVATQFATPCCLKVTFSLGMPSKSRSKCSDCPVRLESSTFRCSSTEAMIDVPFPALIMGSRFCLCTYRALPLS